MALDFYGNQSGRVWQSTPTAHFRLHYDPKIEASAAEVARYAEMAFDTLSQRYGISWSLPADLVVQDALFSNGEASSHANRVKIWSTDWGIPLRSYHPWIADVVQHEFGHLASISAGAKGKPWIFGLHLGVQSYVNRAVRHEFGLFLPFTAQPSWFAEGTAQYESSRMGFDRWDAHRDMIMRSAVAQDRILSLPQMQAFIGPRALDFELGPYTQGFSLVRYIAETYGDDKIPALWKANSKWKHLSFDGAMQEVLGKSEAEIYAEWVQALKKQYADSSTYSEKRISPAWSISNIQSFEGKLWGLSDFGSDQGENILFQLDPKNSRDTSGIYADSNWKVVNAFQAPKIAWDKGFDLERKEGKLRLWAVSFAKRNAQGLASYDLVRMDSAAKEVHWITKYANAFEPKISPSGKVLAYVQKSPYGSCMSLVLQNLDSAGDPMGDSQLLYPQTQSENCLDLQYRDASFSPDGQNIALTMAQGKKRSLVRYHIPSQRTDTLFDQGRDNRDPRWISSTEIAFASDWSGRFESYALRTDSASLRRLSATRGGAFKPLVADQQFYYVGYDADGFGLYQDQLHSTAVQASSSPLQALPSGEAPALYPQKYNAIPRRANLLPLILLDEKALGIRGGRQGSLYAKAGALLEIYDPLDKNSLELTLLSELRPSRYIDPAAGGLSPDFARDAGISWTNTSTPVTSTSMLAYRRLTQSDTVRSEDPRIDPALQNYAIRIWSLAQKWDYSLWKSKDQFSLMASYVNAGFDFYQNNFSFSFLKSMGLGGNFNWSLREKHPQNFLANPGLEANATLLWQQNDLFRQGSFAQSFKVNSSGVVSPNFRSFQTLSSDLRAAYHLAPSEMSRISLTADYSTLPWWKSADSDTLDAFFYPSVSLHGYPAILPSAENPLLQGRSNVLWTLHGTVPLWTKVRSYGPIMQKGAWLDLFGEHLWLWQNPPAWKDWNQAQFLSSLGAELRLSQKVFYSIPLEFYVRASKALSTAHSKEGSWQVQAIDGSRSSYLPSSIEWGLSFRFTEPGEVSLFPRIYGHSLSPLSQQGDHSPSQD